MTTPNYRWFDLNRRQDIVKNYDGLILEVIEEMALSNAVQIDSNCIFLCVTFSSLVTLRNFQLYLEV